MKRFIFNLGTVQATMSNDDEGNNLLLIDGFELRDDFVHKMIHELVEQVDIINPAINIGLHDAIVDQIENALMIEFLVNAKDKTIDMDMRPKPKK